MNNQVNKHWSLCDECNGQGDKRQRLRKKVKLEYQRLLSEFKNNETIALPPLLPKGALVKCKKCDGSGLIESNKPTPVDRYNLPHIAIIGAGIGGVALAVACLHRGIPFSLFEKDESFNSRAQGYGLTLQQAHKAMKSFGITELHEGITSTKHIVHTKDGIIIGEWGARKWLEPDVKAPSKQTNIHIGRQALRLNLLNQLIGKTEIQWGHELIDFKERQDKVQLTFKTKNSFKTFEADLIVGADGIRSNVRRLLPNEDTTPLRYLNCIVILGICSLNALKNIKSPLLDSETVFQTANGNERLYVMPYSTDSVMWQLSFPMPENEAKELSNIGTLALKQEAIKRTQWHSPIPEIITNTPETLITGYPVYDRELLNPSLLLNLNKTTLIGDAAHPMSPFKGQGANQALLDAIELARIIYKTCKHQPTWKAEGLRKSVLNDFEESMINRTASKVKDSNKAAQFLHSDIVLYKGNEPRGKCLKRKPTEL